MAIVKILARHSPSYSSLIQYILSDEKVDDKTIVVHNLRGNTIDEYVNEYKMNESFRQRSRSDQVFMRHEIISFHRDEDHTQFSSEVLRGMINQYIEIRGVKGMYIGAVHRDTEHVHIHLAVSALEYRSGKSFHVAKPELHLLKTRFQKYHQARFPEINQSAPAHGKGKPYLTDRAWQKANRGSRAKLKGKLSEDVLKCINKSQNMNEFLECLRDINLHHYERSGRIEGVVAENGLKFRFSRLGISEQLEAFKLKETENLMKQEKYDNMNTKIKNKENMDEYAKAYLECQIRELDKKYEDNLDQINEIYLTLQNSPSDEVNQEQKKELDRLEKLEQKLLNEKQDLEISRQILIYDIEEKEIEELNQIRTEEGMIKNEKIKEDKVSENDLNSFLGIEQEQDKESIESLDDIRNTESGLDLDVDLQNGL